MFRKLKISRNWSISHFDQDLRIEFERKFDNLLNVSLILVYKPILQVSAFKKSPLFYIFLF